MKCTGCGQESSAEHARIHALDTLMDIANESNVIRHPFQNIYPMWHGKPLSIVLIDVIHALRTERIHRECARSLYWDTNQGKDSDRTRLRSHPGRRRRLHRRLASSWGTRMRRFWMGIASAVLVFVGLWQMEIVFIQFAWGFPQFVLPFGFTVEWWIARDLFYSMILASWILALLTDTKRRLPRGVDGHRA